MLNNRIIVYCYVCGDILHKGHLLMLENAKKLGDILIAGVLTDGAVMEKKKKPIISFEERLELVRSIKYVDIVFPQDTYAPWDNVKSLFPDILIESISHSEEIIKKSKECIEKIGGELVVFPYYPCQSSSKIKNEIKKTKI